MCLYRFSGTAVGAFIGIVAVLLFPESRAMTLLALFLCVGFCAYMTRYSEKYLLAAIKVCIVILASVGEENRLVFGMLRVVEIGVGVLCAFVVSIVLWPMRAGDALRARLRERFNACAETYQTLMDAFLSLQIEIDPQLVHRLDRDIREDRALYLKIVRHERWVYNENVDLLGRKVRTLEACSTYLQTMLHALNSVDGKGYEIIMEKELRELVAATLTVMSTIGSGGLPRLDELSHALDQAETRLLELREGGATRRFHLQKLVQFFAFYHGAHSMGKAILRYGRQLGKG
jgi:uncharacterized membrane protein YgaE (UPF0421/DUF939 family)